MANQAKKQMKKLSANKLPLTPDIAAVPEVANLLESLPSSPGIGDYPEPGGGTIGPNDVDLPGNGPMDPTGPTFDPHKSGEKAHSLFQKIRSGPFEQVQLHRNLGEAERLRDISTSAVGMDDATRENLVGFFINRGMGITPEVDEAIENIASTMTIDWSDPLHTDAIFGSVQKALMNGGPNEAARVMEWMAEFYSLAMQNPTFNRTEMLEILHHWMKGDMDPQVLAAKTQSFLDASTRDWTDPMSAMGLRNPAETEKSRQVRNTFMKILTSLSERPDESQKAVSMGGRAFEQYRQQQYRLWDAASRRMLNPVYTGMGLGAGAAGGMANFIGDFSNPAANLVTWPFAQAAMGLTGAHLMPGPGMVWGEAPKTIGGYQPLQSVPAIRVQPGGGYPVGQRPPMRLNSSEKKNSDKFIRLAQVMDPSIAGGDIHPNPYAPRSESSGLSAWQQDAMHMMAIQMGRTDAAQSTFGQIFSVEEFQRIQALKWDLSRIKQNINAFEEDIRTGRAVADLRLIGQVDQMSQELSDRYDQLIGVYESAMRFALRRREGLRRSLAYGGEDPDGAPQVRQMDLLLKQTAEERNKVRLEREQWLLKSKQASNDLRIMARDVMSVQPLRTMRDVLREGAGADMGASMALAAEEMAQAQDSMDKYRKLRQLDPNISGVQAGHALSQAYQQYLQAIRDIDSSTQPAVPQKDVTKLIGV